VLLYVYVYVYVFGSAIQIPSGRNYHQYLIGGMFGMALVGTAQGTAVGVSADMATGLIDRFRSLPIARSAVLAGRVVTDLLTEVIAIVILPSPAWPWVGVSTMESATRWRRSVFAF
jgi:hypothetical protein